MHVNSKFVYYKGSVLRCLNYLIYNSFRKYPFSTRSVHVYYLVLIRSLNQSVFTQPGTNTTDKAHISNRDWGLSRRVAHSDSPVVAGDGDSMERLSRRSNPRLQELCTRFVWEWIRDGSSCWQPSSVVSLLPWINVVGSEPGWVPRFPYEALNNDRWDEDPEQTKVS
jgi:hypothetical protein